MRARLVPFQETDADPERPHGRQDEIDVSPTELTASTLMAVPNESTRQAAPSTILAMLSRRRPSGDQAETEPSDTGQELFE